MWNNQVIKAEGCRQFKQNYWPCVAVAILMGLTDLTLNFSGNVDEYGQIGPVFFSTMGAMPGVFMTVLSIFVLWPLAVSAKRFFLVNMLKPANLDEIKYAFTNNYTNIVFVMFMRNLFIFLWTLLLIIPGIIKIYEYRMVEYLLAEDSSMDYKTALNKSREMMYGNKMDAFIFDLSFIGWYIASVFTFGILALFWVAPYKDSADAALYIFIRNNTNVMSGYNGGGYDPNGGGNGGNGGYDPNGGNGSNNGGANANVYNGGAGGNGGNADFGAPNNTVNSSGYNAGYKEVVFEDTSNSQNDAYVAPAAQETVPAATDATPEVPVEATPEVVPEVAPAAVSETVPEAAPANASTPEVKYDVVPEAASAEAEVVPEVKPELVIEPTPEVEPVVESVKLETSAAETEVVPEIKPELVIEPTPEVATVIESPAVTDVEFDIEDNEQ